MPPTKVADVEEAIAWLNEGKSYAWIIEQYQAKYGVQTTPSMWSNFRAEHKIALRSVKRDPQLFPWTKIENEHIRLYAAEMLRAESRRRAGKQLSEFLERKLERFKARLKERGEVVSYDPEKGFEYTPARPGIDTDLVRIPD